MAFYVIGQVHELASKVFNFASLIFANVSGDELTGRDLCPDTHKNYEVTIGNNSNSHQFRANQFTLKSNLQVENRARTDEQTECPKVESN